MNSSTEAVAPIVAGPGEGEALWFLGILATVKSSAETTAGAVAVIEHLAPRGAGSPLHVHSREDEWFYVIEGELTFWVGGEVSVAPAGTASSSGRRGSRTRSSSAPRRPASSSSPSPPASSSSCARWASPPRALEIPPPATEPPDVAALTAAAAEYGIEIVGPPGIPA